VSCPACSAGHDEAHEQSLQHHWSTASTSLLCSSLVFTFPRGYTAFIIVMQTLCVWAQIGWL
jgi:hypothetical protein